MIYDFHSFLEYVFMYTQKITRNQYRRVEKHIKAISSLAGGFIFSEIYGAQHSVTSLKTKMVSNRLWYGFAETSFDKHNEHKQKQNL